MKFITLLTDFGLGGSPVAVMKGVILTIFPEAQIYDISHAIRPQDILSGSTTLGWAAPYFPAGSVHVAVVDPGVGTTRRPIAAWLGDRFYVGPDNGLCTRLLERAEHMKSPVEIIHLDRPEFWLPEVSSTFHGRDIFAPVGAHIARGMSLKALGTPISDPVRLTVPAPQKITGGWRTEVNHIDDFGNLYLTMERRDFEASAPPRRVHVGEAKTDRLVNTFGEAPAGELVFLFDASDRLSISIVNGSAAKTFNIKTGDPVEVFIVSSQ